MLSASPLAGPGFDVGEDGPEELAELVVVFGDREVAELGHFPELGALEGP